MTEHVFDGPDGVSPETEDEFCGNYARTREGGEQGGDNPGDWFAVSRGMEDHPVVGLRVSAPTAADPERRAWTPTEAWTFGIVGRAAFRRRTVRDTNGAQVVLEAGQLRASRRVLARKFNWSEKAVRVFLGKLESAEMISVFSGPGSAGIRARGKGQGSAVLTVSNYGKYQSAAREKGQGKGQPPRRFGASYKNNKTKQPPYPQRGRSDFDGLKIDDATSSDIGSESNAAPWDNRPLIEKLKAHDPRYWWRMIEAETRGGCWPPALGPSPADEPTELHREIDERLADILASRGVPTVRQVSMPANVVPLRSLERASA